MIWIETGPRSAEPVTLGEAKAFLRIERDDEDALLLTLIAAAREMVEAQTGLFLRQGAFRLVFEAAVGRARIELTRRPVNAVTKVLAFDGEGTGREVDPASVTVETQALRSMFVLPGGLASTAPNGLEIEVEAGLAVGEVPETIRLAILRLVAASYELRAHVSSGQQPAVMPPVVRGLVAPFRSLGL